MKNTERFSNRVDNYVKHRPSYPEAAIHYLLTTVGLNPGCTVADIGAGTGIFTRLIAPVVGRVYAVEPNGPMRAAAARTLREFAHCVLVDAPAEATTLPGQSVDFITCAQAFHWLDRVRCRVEFHRILIPGGRVAIVWNKDEFGDDYEALRMRYCPEYPGVTRKRLTDADYRAFFGGDFTHAEFPATPQHFDRNGFLGRVMSSSYTPPPEDAHHKPLMEAMSGYFDKHAPGGVIELRYKTEIIVGRSE